MIDLENNQMKEAKGDAEAMPMDPSFITSLGYGMPSAGGSWYRDRQINNVNGKYGNY